MTTDDQDSVNSVIESLGLYGALIYAFERLPNERDPRIRRMMILITRETSAKILLAIKRAKRLAACHRIGLRTLGIHV